MKRTCPRAFSKIFRTSGPVWHLPNILSHNVRGGTPIYDSAQISGVTYFWEPLQHPQRLISFENFSLQFQLISYVRCKFVGDAFIPGLGEFDTSDQLRTYK